MVKEDIRLPRLHKDVLAISLLHYREIKKAYSEVLGLNAIDHLSINMVNPEGEIVFLSSTPSTGQNVCGTGLLRYDCSISPKMYENHDFYWWDSCYAPDMKNTLKLEKEIKNNLSCGFILTQHIADFHMMYSFATREADPHIRNYIEDYKQIFVDMGGHCYDLIRRVYEQYSGGYSPPRLTSLKFPKSRLMQKE